MKSNHRPLVKVWDLPTRLFHWTLVTLFLFLVISGELGGQLMRWHILSGCLLSGLIIFRVIWGILGSYHARFINFVRSPNVALMYLLALFKGNAGVYMGHNPAGAIMVLLLLIALCLQALTGLVTTDDVLWSGPLYSWVNEAIAEWGAAIHHALEVILKLLVIVHILSVLVHEFYFKDPIVGAMIHGYKVVPQDHKVEANRHNRALILGLVVSGAWVMWLWSLPL